MKESTWRWRKKLEKLGIWYEMQHGQLDTQQIISSYICSFCLSKRSSIFLLKVRRSEKKSLVCWTTAIWLLWFRTMFVDFTKAFDRLEATPAQSFLFSMTPLAALRIKDWIWGFKGLWNSRGRLLCWTPNVINAAITSSLVHYRLGRDLGLLGEIYEGWRPWK